MALIVYVLSEGLTERATLRLVTFRADALAAIEWKSDAICNHFEVMLVAYK